MICTKCATELPVEANFCWKCGQPVKEAGAVTPAETSYELCEIVLNSPLLGGATWEATLGGQVIARTPKFSSFSGGLELEKRDELIAQLTAQGWQIVSTGDEETPATLRRKKKKEKS
jgi:hypothetical protein